MTEAIRNPFVPEPFVLLVLVSFLLALEAGAGMAVLALILVAGALTKEILLALLPLLWVAARRDARGLAVWGRAALAGLPALVATAGLRWWWAPHLRGGDLPSDPGTVVHAVGLVLSSWPLWWQPALVTGLVPLALLGALRHPARPFLRRYGYLVAIYAALPFMAAVYVGTDERPAMFFSGDIPRLTLHLLPFLIPLTLIALDRFLPHRDPRATAQTRTPRILRLVAAVLALTLAVVPFALLDRYRRFDLSTVRDGLLVLATARGSWRVAERIEAGRRVTFGPETSWVPGRDIPPLMEHMRWFLRDGWGVDPQYGSRAIRLEGPQGQILVPCLAPRDLRIGLLLVADEHERLLVRFNGKVLGTIDAGRQPIRSTLRAPRDAVFRGDNVLTLERSGTSRRGPRLLRLVVREMARGDGSREMGVNSLSNRETSL